jgi:F-type H+-transporting ATPase subunit gamma
MGAQLRAVRRRIGAVQSTAKITRAQELIASSRIIRAQQRVRAAAPYARELTRAVESVVSGSPSITHPMITEAANPGRAAVVRPGHRRAAVRVRDEGHRLAPVPAA